ncbi:MAG: alpha/beta hydrolase [Bdellovibrionales bacterium]
MSWGKLVQILIFLFSSSSFALTNAEVRALDLPKELLEIENKDIESFKLYDGLEMQSLVLGPKEGPSAILITGYGSNQLYYLQTAIELSKNGYRTYLFNPRGLGNNIFKSQNHRGNTEFSIIRIIEDFHQIAEIIFTRNSKPVLVMGHSLGGIIVRFLELGIGLHNNKIYYSKERSQLFRSRVAVKVVASSPGIIVSPEKVKMDWETRNFLTSLPYLLDLNHLFEPFTKYLLKLPFSKETLLLSLRGASYASPSVKGILDPSLINKKEAWNFIKYGSAEEIPAELKDDLIKMAENPGRVIRYKNSQLDIIDIYESQKNNRVPLILTYGEDDYLVDKSIIQQEIQFLEKEGSEVKLLELEGSHMNTVIGFNNIRRIVSETLKLSSK